MFYTDKQVLFSEFLSKWDSQFKKIPYILKYLSSYPEFNKKLEDFIPLDSENLDNSQLEWISLVAQLERPVESNFFKDYWVPIQKDKYGYFIDLSSDKLPIFEAHYFFHEPYRWYKKYIAKDLSQFLIEIDNPEFNIEKHLEEIDEERWSYISDLFLERDELGFAGKLNLDPLTKECILNKDMKSGYSFRGNTIRFKGVNSLIVGLLSLETEITLEDFRAPFNRNPNIFEKVRNVKALVYLLQSVGMLSIDYFTISIGSNKEPSCAIW